VLCVDRVGLTAPSADCSVGPIHVDDLRVVAAQMPVERGAVGAGALNARRPTGESAIIAGSAETAGGAEVDLGGRMVGQDEGEIADEGAEPPCQPAELGSMAVRLWLSEHGADQGPDAVHLDGENAWSKGREVLGVSADRFFHHDEVREVGDQP